jgi:hypothetical protein
MKGFILIEKPIKRDRIFYSKKKINDFNEFIFFFIFIYEKHFFKRIFFFPYF